MLLAVSIRYPDSHAAESKVLAEYGCGIPSPFHTIVAVVQQVQEQKRSDPLVAVDFEQNRCFEVGT